MTVSQKRQGLLFLLVGPPGVGKNTLMQAALSPRSGNLRQLPTATTRLMRANEQQGREHLFVTQAEFQQMIADDALIEWQNVHHDDLYGVPRATVEAAILAEEDLIADIEVLGATILKSVYPDNVILIFITPPSVADLITRMHTRGEPEDEIAARLQRVDMEMSYAPLCDYLIVNDNLANASQTLRAIILAEASRRALANLRVENRLPRHRLAYAASILPLYGTDVLCHNAPPHFPTTLLAYGEMPHEAALRILGKMLDMDVSAVHLVGGTSGAFAPAAVKIVSQEQFQQVTFVYRYTLPYRILAPEGWGWRLSNGVDGDII